MEYPSIYILPQLYTLRSGLSDLMPVIIDANVPIVVNKTPSNFENIHLPQMLQTVIMRPIIIKNVNIHMVTVEQGIGSPAIF